MKVKSIIDQLFSSAFYSLFSIALVTISPWIFKYSRVKPLVEGGLPSDTITIYYSGFPIPFMQSSNLALRKDISFIIFSINVLILYFIFITIKNYIKRKKTT